MRNIMTELCYEDDLQRQIMTKYWNKPRIKVLTVLQVKSLLAIQNTLLTRSCLLFNFLALQDPRRLLYVLCKSSSSYYWTCQRPKFRVFKQLFLVHFIMAEMYPYGRNAAIWQKRIQMAETLPNGRNVSKWQKRCQMAERYPNGRNAAKWQKGIHTVNKFYAMIIWLLSSFAIFVSLFITLQRHLCFQKFVNQFSLFFS